MDLRTWSYNALTDLEKSLETLYHKLIAAHDEDGATAIFHRIHEVVEERTSRLEFIGSLSLDHATTFGEIIYNFKKGV